MNILYKKVQVQSSKSEEACCEEVVLCAVWGVRTRLENFFDGADIALSNKRTFYWLCC